MERVEPTLFSRECDPGVASMLYGDEDAGPIHSGLDMVCQHYVFLNPLCQFDHDDVRFPQPLVEFDIEL